MTRNIANNSKYKLFSCFEESSFKYILVLKYILIEYLRNAYKYFPSKASNGITGQNPKHKAYGFGQNQLSLHNL
jgi:hypothetical protein